jgi:predicted amidophosphoribosyltransferase
MERFPGALLVPVPPRPSKLRRKGWDQVEDIARILEKRHGIAVRRMLTRRGGLLEQKKLDFDERAANMRACMRVRGRVDPSSRYLVLDDVFTTGATLSACALALKNAGASRVDALVLAAD